MDETADFLIGGVSLNEQRAKLFSVTRPYLQASYGFCFREIDTYIPLARLTAPFRIRAWSTITAFSIISPIVILLTKKLNRDWRHFIIGGQMNRTPILNMWTTILGNPIANRKIVSGKHLSKFARIILILWIIMWIVVRNAYQGSLYRHLQKHRLTSPYDTIAKVRKSNCEIKAPLSTFNLIRIQGFSADR